MLLRLPILWEVITSKAVTLLEVPFQNDACLFKFQLETSHFFFRLLFTFRNNSKAKTVSENLKMSPALLSRFDLIFILLDKPNQEMDVFLSEHVMKVMKGSFPHV